MGQKLGQHFLRSRHVLQQVARAVPVPAGGVIVEVGPGKGALTSQLLEQGTVVAVERDGTLVTNLRDRFLTPLLKVHCSLNMVMSEMAGGHTRSETDRML